MKLTIKRGVVGVILVAIVVPTGLWLLLRSHFVPKIISVVPASLTASSVDLAFWSDREAKFVVKILDGNIVVKTVSETTPESKIHLVVVPGLSADKEYRYQIDHSTGLKTAGGGFKTRPFLRSLNLPKTVYGKIVTTDRKTKEGSLVILRRIFLNTKPQVQSAVLAALTNNSGNFIFDLNNVFLEKEPTGSSVEERLEIKVWTKDGRYREVLVPITQTQPIPPIEL